MTGLARLQAACARVRAKEYTVLPGAYGVRWHAEHKRWSPARHARKCMCPLGAVAVVEQPAPGEHATVPAAVGALLGVNMRWIIDFTVTFDGIGQPSGDGADTARALLAWLAEQSQTEPGSDVVFKALVIHSSR